MVAGPNTTLGVRLMDFQGSIHAPVFTSVERISAVVSTEVGVVSMNGEAILQMLRDRDVVLNPGADYGKLLTRLEVESLLDGSMFRAEATNLAAGTTILLGAPAQPPREVMDALSRFFAGRREVSAAYVAEAVMPGAGSDPHPVIGIETSGNFGKLAGELGVIIRAVTGPGVIIDLVQVDVGAHDAISQYLLRETKPFYQRKKFLGLF